MRAPHVHAGLCSFRPGCIVGATSCRCRNSMDRLSRRKSTGDAMPTPRLSVLSAVLVVGLWGLSAVGQERQTGVADGGATGGAKPDASKMPHVSVDVKRREIRIDAEALNPQM